MAQNKRGRNTRHPSRDANSAPSPGPGSTSRFRDRMGGGHKPEAQAKKQPSSYSNSSSYSLLWRLRLDSDMIRMYTIERHGERARLRSGFSCRRVGKMSENVRKCPGELIFPSGEA